MTTLKTHEGSATVKRKEKKKSLYLEPQNTAFPTELARAEREEEKEMKGGAVFVCFKSPSDPSTVKE